MVTPACLLIVPMYMLRPEFALSESKVRTLMPASICLLDDAFDGLRLVHRNCDAADLTGDQVFDDLDLGRALGVLRNNPLIA